MSDFGENDDSVVSESVLDLAMQVYHPAIDLRWHYRSKRASLIAFSNLQFYENRLQIFPSPAESDVRFGVQLRRVKGIYHSGTNRLEAEALVRHASEMMRTHPNYSLGIVALNQAQRELILELIEAEIQRNESAGSYYSRWRGTLEQLFVKNLENVQGEERDIILISAVYGPDETGHVYQRFGPINQDAGHRRLNVLFTRAKYATIVFSSMGAEDIRLGQDSKAGVKALKDYLSFAATGKLERATLTGREPDSEFERMVARDLVQRGFEVTAQVGVSGFYIDLGVKHPGYPYGFLAGIECDGATYHSSKSARDRDRLRQQILEALGWNIVRIWSTDYFRAPQATMAQVEQRLHQLLSSPPAPPEPPPPPDPVPVSTTIFETRRGISPEEIGAIAYPYQTFPRLAENAEELEQLWPHLLDALVKLCEHESPMNRGYAMRRLGELVNVRRLGSRMQARLDQLLEDASRRGVLKVQDDVIWSTGQDPQSWSHVRYGTTREFADIPAIELENAVLAILRSRPPTADSELARAVLPLFGIRKLGARIDSSFTELFETMERAGKLERREGLLCPNAASQSVAALP